MEDFYTDHRSLGYGRPRVADIDYKEKYMLLKKETLHNNDYQNINEYVNGVFDWIWFYKTERISLSERQHNINENIC